MNRSRNGSHYACVTMTCRKSDMSQRDRTTVRCLFSKRKSSRVRNTRLDLRCRPLQSDRTALQLCLIKDVARIRDQDFRHFVFWIPRCWRAVLSSADTTKTSVIRISSKKWQMLYVHITNHETVLTSGQGTPKSHSSKDMMWTSKFLCNGTMHRFW